MNSPNNIQTNPLAVAILNSQKKQYRKLLLEELNESKADLKRLDSSNDKEDYKLWRRCLKAEIKFLTYIFNKNKEETFKSYKKCQELASSLLECCMESPDLPEVETLHVAKTCKCYHETKKHCFRVAIKLDNEIGYWK